MPRVTLPPPAKGIDNLSSRGQAPEGTVRLAENVDISREGVITTRKGARCVIDHAGLHSLYSGAHGALVASRAMLYRVDLAGARLAPVLALGSDDPVSYADVPAGTVAVNATSAVLITPEGLGRPLAPEDAPGPDTLTAIEGGGLAAGQYGVAFAYLMGDQEGALSAASYIQIEAEQGIRVENLPAPESPDVTGIRIYRTTANGNTFYRAADAMPGGFHPLGEDPLGRAADARHLAAFTGGEIVRHWNGRLLVASGNTLWLGEPLRHGLYSPREGFIQRPAPIVMVAATDGAVFVATDDGQTVALIGASPDQWQVRTVDAGQAFAHSDCRVALDTFSGEWATTGALGVVWLTTVGYVVGLPDGTVIAPQKRRLRIGDVQRANTAVIGRRLYTG